MRFRNRSARNVLKTGGWFNRSAPIYARAGELRAALDALASEPPSTDPRLDRPDHPPLVEAALVESSQEGLLCVGEECVPYSAMVEGLRRGLPIADRTYRLRTYKDCFLGSELVDHLVQTHAPRRREKCRTQTIAASGFVSLQKDAQAKII